MTLNCDFSYLYSCIKNHNPPPTSLEKTCQLPSYSVIRRILIFVTNTSLQFYGGKNYGLDGG